MRPVSIAALSALVWLVPAGALAAHTQARLVLNAAAARPGETVLAGIHLRIDPQWHTYWKNPGASGMATTVDWDLPPGITAGPILWPVPHKLPADDLTTYVYENEVVLLVPLSLASDLPPGRRELKARVSWLECKELCLPGSTNLAAVLETGPVAKRSTEAPLIQAWQEKLPQAAPADLSARAAWGGPAKGSVRPLLVQWRAMAAATNADLYPYAADAFEVQGPTEPVPSGPGEVRLRKQVQKLKGDWPDRISGLLIEKTGAATTAYEVTLPVGSSLSGEDQAAPGAAATGGGERLWVMLLYALLGGLILNIMPCVLPVISLKILGFVSEAHSDPRHVRKLGLMFTVGVLFSFLVLAGMVIGIKAAGGQAGWGMQFSNPGFVIAMTVLILLVALNLFGVFEVNLGRRAMETAGSLAGRQGYAGAFLNGLLATALATPCTAPILGWALAFALARSAPVIALVFLFVGFGLALPYLILSFRPAWLSFLPKPGAWMERFKMFMGFPMLATAVWLFTLAASLLGKSDVLWLGWFLVMLALGAWMWGTFVQRGTRRRGLAMAASILLVGGFGAYAMLRPPDQIEWQPWSAAAVADAQARGRPVFVDFTADWCVTCQANKKFAIEVPSVRAKLKQIGAVTLLGDYTRGSAAITTELNRHGRAGVPLVLVYPAKAGSDPIVLPELLTPGMVLNALDRAAK